MGLGTLTIFFNVLSHAGKLGWAAPRLKDAALSEDKLREGYVEVCSKFLVTDASW